MLLSEAGGNVVCMQDLSERGEVMLLTFPCLHCDTRPGSSGTALLRVFFYIAIR